MGPTRSAFSCGDSAINCRKEQMAGFFSQSTLDRVRAASDIVDVVGSYIPLKRAGANFMALCPFHKEKTPSFNVNPQRQIFHCFGCNKGGDVFTFVREYENLDFPEAVKRLADRAGIPMDYEQTGPDRQARHIKDTLLQIHDQISNRWQTALANEASGQVARDYLARRGVSDEAVKVFRLGYAPEAWDDTVNWAKSKGHDLSLVEKAGLVIRNEERQSYYDRFRGRLMFPICDEQGRVVGFSGRILSGDEKVAKYVNSPETPIFTKSKVFFGLDKSRRALLDAGFAIVCEGQLDLIASFMAGIQNVVAPQGTAFTADHARILKRYVNEVVLCFDSDEAGQNATVRALDHLLGSDLAVRVAVVPSPHDPDSLIKEQGAEAFRRVIHEAPGFFDYYLGRLSAQNDVATDKGRLMVLRGMAQAVLKTSNQVLIDKYAQKTALQLGVRPEAVLSEFRKIAARGLPSPAGESREDRGQSETGQAAPPLPPPGPIEQWLLKLLFQHEETVPAAALHLDFVWIQHSSVRQVLQARLAAVRNETWNDVASFLAEIEDPAVRALVTESVVVTRPVPNPEVQLKDVLLKLRNAYLDRQLAFARSRSSQPNISEEERVALLREQQHLRAAKLEPLRENVRMDSGS
jgi:DNA primase